MQSKHENQQYLLAMNEELAEMTVAEYQRWNPGSTPEQAALKIAQAKAEVEKSVGPLFKAADALHPSMA